MKSIIDTLGVGILIAVTSRFHYSTGKTKPTAFAAPVEVGIIEELAVLALLKSPCSPSKMRWSEVKECTVVINPASISKLSLIILATGAKQFVVHEAFDIISCFFSNNLSLTPYTTVISALIAGADIKEFIDYNASAAYDFSENGKSLVNKKGELVCKSAFPSMPIYFWNDKNNKKYKSAYFEKCLF